jgi:P-type Cu2+ transporter
LGPAKLDVTVTEAAGKGVEATIDGVAWRLGSAEWCGIAANHNAGGARVWLSRGGRPVGDFRFADQLRPDAATAVAELLGQGLPVRLLSGDVQGSVTAVAKAVGIADAKGRMTPEDKLADVSHGLTMMIGDGINDAPAMRAAHVSMAPSTAADIGRSAADFVFTTGRLAAVPFIIGTARRAARLVNQNLALAIGYNIVAVPLAVTGHVTPLIAAIAMSSSSIIVVLNGLRLRLGARPAVEMTAVVQPDLAEKIA